MAETLHGTLRVTIYEVDRVHEHFWIWLMSNAKKVFVGESTRKLYVTIDLDKYIVGQTRLLENNTENPKREEAFHIYCAHLASNVIFTVNMGKTVIGRGYVPVKDILEGKEVDRCVVILDDHKNPVEGKPNIHVKLQFLDATEDSNWGRGIYTSEYAGVPRTLFPQQQGCRVTLYQDAHVPNKFIPSIPLSGGDYYQPHRCWEDVFDAITNAKHFIYITGWSVNTKISLIRDPTRQKSGGHVTLGDFLINKSKDGVKVLMLVWKDTSGRMATHDEDTKIFFQNSEVHCVLCPRYRDGNENMIQRFKTKKIYTHHQKTIVVDAPLPSGDSDKRQVVSFVGGLDLCDGRYDTPFHSLFRTLDTAAHRDDFHQPNFAEAAIAKGGPREPWHDIHSKLEGPIARDVLSNFEQRWRKQGGENVLVNLDDIISPSQVDQESWNVQLFRSIDDGSAFGFPDLPKDAAKLGVVTGEYDNMIDRSIQDAYIHAIRRAKNFIYIESQYFIGSSFAWQADGIKDTVIKKAMHLIPRELSLKIVSKIKAGEEFTVYVVVPMWPEGIPESKWVQAMLDLQRRTMEMMYKDIIKALQGKDKDPREYLTFFCLGNREVKSSVEYEPSEAPEADSNYQKAQAARRFMIYMHSKMMIVDDEYIIVGSANINQRSMDGARDSEIAMGAYQPHHIATRTTPAKGQVHGFRMALWYEHLGMLDDSFQHPESTECVSRVNQIADENWDLFASSENLESDLPCHLLRYPVDVTSEGNVTKRPGIEVFLDTKARVLGTKLSYLLRIVDVEDVI